MSRLKDNILKIGRIGQETDGSITRLGFSKEYFLAAEKTKELMANAGLDTFIDRVGNVRGFKKGTDKTKKIIAIGSHLDTVQNGGIFDGNVGVMAGIECVYRLEENNKQTRHSIEIIGFNWEEANPSFGGLFGSSAMAGLLNVEETGFTEKIRELNINCEDILSAKVNIEDYKCYLEMHIEQGDTLFSEKLTIGVVLGIVGIIRYRISAQGECNHSGTTRMESRRDALVGMSKLIVQINKLAKEYGSDLVATVGKMKIEPGAINIIPGNAEAVLELRNMDETVYHRFVNEIIEFSKSIPDAQFSFEKISEKGSVHCNERIVGYIEQICREKSIPYGMIPSGAGHDAKIFGKCLPMGMIFVPSKNGISHSKYEWTDWDDIETGADVLYEIILKLDES